MKLSERLRELSAAQEPCEPFTHDFGKKAAFEEAAQLAEAYEAKVEKRERSVMCLHCSEVVAYSGEVAREQIFYAMRAHDLICASSPLVKRIAELERQNAELTSCVTDLTDSTNLLITTSGLLRERLADLESQLAWAPVRDGLPTEPGVYEFAAIGSDGCVDSLDAYLFEPGNFRPWTDMCHCVSLTEDELGECDYTHYRRIELPEAAPPFAKDTSPDAVRELHVAQGCVVPPTTTLTDEAQDADLPSVTVSITPPNTLNVDLNALEWVSLAEAGALTGEVVRNLDRLIRQPLCLNDYIASVPARVTTAIQLHVKAVAVMNAEISKGRLFKEGGKWRFFQ